MTPFHPDLENDAGHAIDQDDLIAFHLHELSSPEERALRRVLHTNPALQSESLAIASTLRAFPKHEPALPLDAAALDRHWQALRPSLIAYIPPTPTPFAFFKLPAMRWALPTAAAAILTTTALILALHHTPQTPPPTIATSTPPAPATAPNPLPPLSAIPPSISVPAGTSIPSVPLNIASSPAKPTPQTNPFVPTNLSQTQPTSTQPTTAPPPASAAPTNISIAANHQSTSIAPPASSAPTTARPISRPHHDHVTDITLAVLGNFTPDRSFTSTTGTGASTVTTPYEQTASPTVGILASFHQQLRPWLGYRLTATHSEPTFEYTYSPAGGGSAGVIVPQNAYEFSATYVLQGPRHRRISTNAEAGAGVLAFHPTNPDVILGVTSALRPTAVLGVSADLSITKHWAIHAGYRALLYKSPPAYLASDFNVPAAGNLTFSNEPVIGLTYRFHPTREE